MTTVDGNDITIRLVPKGKYVTLSALTRALKETLDILSEIDKESSGGEETIRWEVVEASTKSPLLLRIEGHPRQKKFTRDVASKYMKSLEKVNRGKEPPAYFPAQAIYKMKALAGLTKNEPEGVEQITFSTTDRQPIELTEKSLEEVETVLKCTFYRTHTTLMGRVQKIDLHGRQSFVIYDTLTDHPVTCFFKDELYRKVIKALKERVSVTGSVKYNRNSETASSMRVESIEIMQRGKNPPRFKDGEAIDITGGIDSVEYIRRMRDEE